MPSLVAAAAARSKGNKKAKARAEKTTKKLNRATPSQTMSAGLKPCANNLNAFADGLPKRKRNIVELVKQIETLQARAVLRCLHLLPLADTTAAAAFAKRAAGNGTEAATLLGEPLSGHLPVLAVDGHAHAASADEHASATPQLHGAEVVGELCDQVACDDGTCESEDGGARVHHASPLAEFCLRGGVGS